MSKTNPTEGLPSLFRFKFDTGIGRGEELQAIDSRLEEYHSLKKRRVTRDDMAVALEKVILACEDWFKAKAEKAINEKVTRKGKGRRKVIGELTANAAYELAYYNYHLKKGLGKERSQKPTMTPMGKTYQFERTMFKELRKDFPSDPKAHVNPVSGSWIHALQDPGNLMYLYKVDPEILKMLQTLNFETVTLDDFKRIWAEVAPKGIGAIGAVSRTHYVRKDERMKENMVTFIKSLMYVKGNQLNTKAIGAKRHATWIWAMNEDGVMATVAVGSNTNLNLDGLWEHRAQWNHSSLFAGKKVLCAGTLEAVDGVLTYIDNKSGHYRPSRQNLIEALHFLEEEEDVALEKTRVCLMENGKLWQFNDGTTLCRNPEATGTFIGDL